MLDARFDLGDKEAGRRAYGQGHIPGAWYADLERDLSSAVTANSGRHPLPDRNGLAVTLAAWGVRHHSHVVVYDDAGGAFAARAWWLSRWLGHERVSVLDGGLKAWCDQGGALSRETPALPPGDIQPSAPLLQGVAVTELEQELAQGAVLLLDARAAERFEGAVEPIDTVAGHVPGAVNVPFTGNLDEDGRFLAPKRLRQRFEQVLQGVAPEKVVHMCGSGVTACHNILAMELAGLSGSRLYAGSWSEWIRDGHRAVATGSA